jgi:PAS domain S-box-containing protein
VKSAAVPDGVDSSPHSATVLIVDDSDKTRQFFVRVLSSEGYRVANAATGLEALRAAALRPDLIILDVKLPDLNGMEVCRRIKQDPATAAIPVLQVSGLPAGGDFKARALDGGADAYLPLPTTASELTATVRSLLRVRQRRRESEEQSLRQRLAQARAIIEVGTAITSSLDLDAVFELIVERACHLLGTPRSGIAILDPDTPSSIRFAAVRGLSADFTALRPLHARDGTTPAAIAQRRAVWSADVLTDPALDLTESTRRQVEREGYRAALSAPLVVRDHALGALVVYRDTAGAFSAEEVELLQMFAGQAAVAIDNARLYTETTRRRREAELLAELARTINESLDLDVVLRRVVEGARELCRADVAWIGLPDPDSDAVHIRQVSGSRIPSPSRLPVVRGQGLGGLVLETGRPHRTRDCLSDARITTRYAELARLEGIVASLAVPIAIGGTVAGLLTVDRRDDRPFTDHDEEVLSRLAHQAGAAICNAEAFRAQSKARADAEAAVDALARSEERLRLVSRATNDAVWDWDLVANTLRWNDAVHSLFGYAAEALEPDIRWWEEHVHPDDRDGVLGSVQAMLERRDEESWAGEYRFRCAGGNYAYVFDRGYIIRDAQGRGVRMIGAMQNITERKALEEQLRQAQKMDAIGQLAGGIAHDFNNLLTVISGRGELLLRKRINAVDPAYHDVDLIVKTARRAASLTQQLLAFSRRQILQPKVLDLNELLRNLEPILRRLIGEDVEVAFIPGAGVIRVKADPAQFEQIIVNLVVNARDAMPSGGRLVVRTSEMIADDAFVQLHADARPIAYGVVSVSDTGVGIDPQTQARIFEPFFTTKEVGKGTGLGLSTVYGIVRQHNGLIHVDSEVGKGSTFRIYFPLVDEPAEPVLTVESRGPRGVETLLLVEDEPDVRDLARDILRYAGYNIITAANAGEALLITEKEGADIHLLVTDVIMPLMSGRQLAERLRLLHPTMKILLMSGYTHAIDDDRQLLSGETAFLPKPFTAESLMAKVREVLDRPEGKPAHT